MKIENNVESLEMNHECLFTHCFVASAHMGTCNMVKQKVEKNSINHQSEVKKVLNIDLSLLQITLSDQNFSQPTFHLLMNRKNTKLKVKTTEDLVVNRNISFLMFFD